MIKKRIAPLALAVAAAVALVAGASIGTVSPAAAQQATPTPVTTGNIKLVAINPGICFALIAANPANAGVAGDCTKLDVNGAGSHNALLTIDRLIGNNDGIIEPSDFAGIDLDGNQVHQSDPPSSTNLFNGNLFIIAFVSSQAPVRFVTNLGYIIPPGLNDPAQAPGTTDPAGQVYVCDSQAGANSGPEVEDADCSPGTSGNEDHVVVARLRANWGNSLPVAPIGPGTVTVNQGQTDVGTIGFRVVGEPRTLSFTTLETSIQDGVDVAAGQCPLPGGASGFLDANGTAERSIVLAIAKDIDGNAVTGAAIEWATDDENKAHMAAPLTPTLDLGAFGFGAPNIICGTTNPGTATVTATIHQDLAGQVLNFDLSASPASATTSFTVVGVPAKMTLASDPPTLPCDGTGTATVSATLTDAAGTPAVAGTSVNFNVQVLGTANPADAKTDDKGVATSVISPLSTDASGVPVIVTAGDLTQSVLVSCVKGAAVTPVPTSPGGTTGGRPTGVTLPNTGRSGDGVAGGLAGWLAVLAMSGLGLLAGSALVWTGARAKRR